METAIHTFIFTSTVVFCLLFLIWSTKTWLNFCIRAIFFGMSVFGIILSGKFLGIF